MNIKCLLKAKLGDMLIATYNEKLALPVEILGISKYIKKSKNEYILMFILDGENDHIANWLSRATITQTIQCKMKEHEKNIVQIWGGGRQINHFKKIIKE